VVNIINKKKKKKLEEYKGKLLVKPIVPILKGLPTMKGSSTRLYLILFIIK